MLLIDSLAYSSRFRHVNPGKKMILTILLVIWAVIRQSAGTGLILILIMGALSVWGSGTPLRIYLRLLRLPLMFILLSLTAIAVTISPDPETGLSVFFSTADVYRGACLAVSALGAVSCMYFLALTTPLTDMFDVLEKLKCPSLVIELMMLTYRFVFLLWSIAGELNRAADSRLGNRNIKTSIRTSGQIFITLLIRALTRSFALYDAMDSRGYQGKIQVLSGTGKRREK